MGAAVRAGPGGGCGGDGAPERARRHRQPGLGAACGAGGARGGRACGGARAVGAGGRGGAGRCARKDSRPLRPAPARPVHQHVLPGRGRPARAARVRLPGGPAHAGAQDDQRAHAAAGQAHSQHAGRDLRAAPGQRGELSGLRPGRGRLGAGRPARGPAHPAGRAGAGPRLLGHARRGRRAARGPGPAAPVAGLCRGRVLRPLSGARARPGGPEAAADAHFGVRLAPVGGGVRRGPAGTGAALAAVAHGRGCGCFTCGAAGAHPPHAGRSLRAGEGREPTLPWRVPPSWRRRSGRGPCGPCARLFRCGRLPAS